MATLLQAKSVYRKLFRPMTFLTVLFLGVGTLFGAQVSGTVFSDSNANGGTDKQSHATVQNFESIPFDGIDSYSYNSALDKSSKDLEIDPPYSRDVNSLRLPTGIGKLSPSTGNPNSRTVLGLFSPLTSRDNSELAARSNLLPNEMPPCDPALTQHYACTETINLSAIAPDSVTSVQWFKDSLAITGATANTYIITAPGSYYYTGVVGICPGNMCCPIVVIKDPCPCTNPILSVTQPLAVCSPLTTDLSTVSFADANNVHGAITYYANAADAVAATNALTSTVIATSGTYFIRKQDTTAGVVGTCFDTARINVVINPKPIIPDANITICQFTSTDLTSAIAAYASLTNQVWTIGSVSGATISNPTSVSPTVSTAYYLVAENATACRDTALVLVNVTAKPVLGPDSTLVCDATANTTTSVNFNLAGTWTVLTQPAGASTNVDNQGLATGLTATGTYTLQVDVNGCKDTINITKPVCTPIPTMSLGNLVFNDTNNDGILNNGETGISGIEVQLYGVGPDGIKGTADDILVGTQTTTSTGGYLFTGLTAGSYFVKLTGAGIPAGMVSSTGGGPADQSGAGTYEPSGSTTNGTDNGTQMGSMVMSSVVVMVYTPPYFQYQP
jgi:hypothetical protein